MEDFVVKTLVDSIVTEQFRTETEGCTSYLFEKVQNQMAKEVIKLQALGKSSFDIILQLKQTLQATFHSEKLLYESVYTPTSKAHINLHYSDSEDEDSNSKVKNENIENKEATKENSTQQYYKYLCEYQKDPDIDSRVKGLEMRGKQFRVSNDGSCPECSHKANVFVILDFLFPSGDMPELLHFLITRGKAVLWSSKENLNCKDPPTFLCSGKCPVDVNKSGFNINWKTTDLDKIYLFPEQNYKEKRKSKPDVNVTRSTPLEKDKANESTLGDLYLEDEEFLEVTADEDYSDEEYDEGEVNITYYRNKVSWVVLDEIIEEPDEMPFQEEGIIRTMLALEEARTDYIYGEMKTKDDIDDDKPVEVIHISNETKELEARHLSDLPINETPTNLTSASSAAYDIMNQKNKHTVPSSVPAKPTPTHILKGATYYDSTKATKESKPAFTAADFPVSKNGACPYCHSTDVVYIILQEDDDNNAELPELLKKLHQNGKAVKMKRGDYDLPSFQCNGCTYGFNLDWTVTNLDKIYNTPSVPVSAMQHQTGHYAYDSYYNQGYGQYPLMNVPYANPWMPYMTPHMAIPYNPYVMPPYGGMPPFVPTTVQWPSSHDMQKGTYWGHTAYTNSKIPAAEIAVSQPGVSIKSTATSEINAAVDKTPTAEGTDVITLTDESGSDMEVETTSSNDKNEQKNIPVATVSEVSNSVIDQPAVSVVETTPDITDTVTTEVTDMIPTAASDTSSVALDVAQPIQSVVSDNNIESIPLTTSDATVSTTTHYIVSNDEEGAKEDIYIKVDDIVPPPPPPLPQAVQPKDNIAVCSSHVVAWKIMENMEKKDMSSDDKSLFSVGQLLENGVNKEETSLTGDKTTDEIARKPNSSILANEADSKSSLSTAELAIEFNDNATVKVSRESDEIKAAFVDSNELTGNSNFSSTPVKIAHLDPVTCGSEGLTNITAPSISLPSSDEPQSVEGSSVDVSLPLQNSYDLSQLTLANDNTVVDDESAENLGSDNLRAGWLSNDTPDDVNSPFTDSLLNIVTEKQSVTSQVSSQDDVVMNSPDLTRKVIESSDKSDEIPHLDFLNSPNDDSLDTVPEEPIKKKATRKTRGKRGRGRVRARKT